MQRDVSSRIVLDVRDTSDLVFAIAPSRHYALNHEQMSATLDGHEVEVHELSDVHGTRLHRLTAEPGGLIVEYGAMVFGHGTTATAGETDLLRYARPSRYAPSDELAATAAAVVGAARGFDALIAVSSWVGTQLSYVPGSSGPTDGATATLLSRKGVCRDYAHLCVALLRGVGIPARLVAVYAPGLDPMDFHAVAEAWIDGAWCVVDATTLAPRSTLVRISTGRDAADTAFLTTVSGRANLTEMTVSATADDLPSDDLDRPASIS
ncbi:transglutaminase family protein [Microbacterium koreense]|uniref:Transglutaminase family protein n=1 Tax=Microbacterium koreense TaxID=323761 RepID=A0ABW2ZU41_9MICO